jgi:class 3 adenylate cyclase
VPAEIKCSNCGAESSVEAHFCWACGHPLSAEGEVSVAPSGARGDDEDEMRPITALFADVVGSTRLGEHLSPDEVKLLIGECVGGMSRAVEEFGGVVQAYLGDGICAYFGVPVAHGDDAERAGRAALRIIQTVHEQRRDIAMAWGVTDLNVRIGINSGPAAVGLVGGAEPQEVALGDATNVAARLQAIAEPGTIVIGPLTARQVADFFALEPLGEHRVKGREETVAAWRLIDLRSSSARRPSSPLIGRTAEVSALRAISRELRAGRGQVVVFSAAAGLGKSRLLGELEAEVGDEVTWLQGHCRPFGGQVPYAPFVEMLEGWLGVERGEAEISVRTKLRARLLGLSSSSAPRQIAFLSRLLSVKVDPQLESELVLPPEELAAGIRRSYVEWIESLTDRSPVVVALEDVHNADATTRALAEDLVALTDSAPLCVATTMENKTSSEGWGLRVWLLTEYAHRTSELPVLPLTEEASLQLLDLLTPAGTLEPGLRSEIVRRAEGNPFYLKELLRAVLEGGGMGRDSTWTVSADLPPALEGLMMARIDRLPSHARRAAQVAAVVGRDFSYDLLQSVSETLDLRHSMAALLRAEFVRERRRYPRLEYTFTSGLLHEAVLATLTPARIRILSGKIAGVLEAESQAAAEENPAQIAFYYYRSDEPKKALHYLERAAARAESLDASTHASELRRRALKAAKAIGDQEAIRRAEAALR